MANYLADVLFVHGVSKAAVNTALTRNKMWGFDEATESIGVKDDGGTMRWFHSLGSPSGAHPNSILSEVKGVNAVSFFDLYRDCDPLSGDSTFLGLRNKDYIPHGITDWQPTDVFLGLNMVNAVDGGAEITGISQDSGNSPLGLYGFVVNGGGGIGGDDGCVRIGVGKKNGTGINPIADSDIAVAIDNLGGGNDLLDIYGNGDAELKGEMSCDSLTTTNDINLGRRILSNKNGIQMKQVVLDDDQTVTLQSLFGLTYPYPQGILIAWCNNNINYCGMWAMGQANTVLLLNGSNNAAADTDTKLCLYYNASTWVFKNRIGLNGLTFSLMLLSTVSS